VLNAFSVVEASSLPAQPTAAALTGTVRQAEPRYAVTMHLERETEAVSTFTLRVWELAAPTFPFTEYSISYEDPQEVLSTMPFSVWQITSVLPVDYINQENSSGYGGEWYGGGGYGRYAVAAEDAWKTGWIYLGFQAGVAAKMYTAASSRSIGTAFTPGVHIEFQPAAFQWNGYYFAFSLQTVVSVGQDAAYFRAFARNEDETDINKTVSRTSTLVEYKSYFLTLPLLFKFSFKPERYLVSPYAGAYINLPLAESADYSPPLGMILGIELGAHAGPGIVYLDLAYSADLGESRFKVIDGDDIPYRKMTVSAALGYSFGIGVRSNSR
jgi:hypothetical protein